MMSQGDDGHVAREGTQGELRSVDVNPPVALAVWVAGDGSGLDCGWERLWDHWVAGGVHPGLGMPARTGGGESEPSGGDSVVWGVRGVDQGAGLLVCQPID